MLDMLAIEDMQLDCTSCKTREKADARCADCAQFLCKCCVMAHRQMLCFESHNVVSFEEILRTYRSNVARRARFADEQKQRRSKSPASSASPSTGLVSSSSSSSSVSSSSGNNVKQQQQSKQLFQEMSMLNEKMKKMNHSKAEVGRLMFDCGVPIHKPLRCREHPKETYKFFCTYCQV